MQLIVGSIDYSADSYHLDLISRVMDFFIFFPMKYLLLAVRFGCSFPGRVRFWLKVMLLKLMISSTSEVFVAWSF